MNDPNAVATHLMLHFKQATLELVEDGGMTPRGLTLAASKILASNVIAAANMSGLDPDLVFQSIMRESYQYVHQMTCPECSKAMSEESEEDDE